MGASMCVLARELVFAAVAVAELIVAEAVVAEVVVAGGFVFEVVVVLIGGQGAMVILSLTQDDYTCEEEALVGWLSRWLLVEWEVCRRVVD